MEKDSANRIRLIKKVVYWALMVIFVLWISNRAADFEKVVVLIKSAEISWISIAFLTQIFYIVLYGSLYHLAMSLTGYNPSYLRGIEAYISSLFFSITTPLGGFGSSAYLARYHSKKIPIPIGGIMSGLIFGMLAFNFSFLLILTPVLVYLYYSSSQLLIPSTIAAAIFLGTVAVYWIVLFVAVKKPLSLKKSFFTIKRIYQRLWHVREGSILSFDDERLEKNLQAYIIASKAIRKGNGAMQIVKTFLIALSVHMTQFIVLFAVFSAFSVDVSLGIIIIAYAIYYLFAIVSPTPQGLGFVEGLMQVVLISLGVSGEESLVVTLVYRAINTWFPVILGFIVFKKMGFTNRT